MNDRDAQLRRRMLNLARIWEKDHGSFVAATVMVAQAKDDEGRPVDGDDHAERLLGGLVEWGLLTTARDPHHQAGVKREFRHRRYQITTKGWALWMQDIPPIAGVADSRWEAE